MYKIHDVFYHQINHAMKRILFGCILFHILEIKEETSQFSSLDPQNDVVAHFMNVEVVVNERHPKLYTFQKFDKRRAIPF